MLPRGLSLRLHAVCGHYACVPFVRVCMQLVQFVHQFRSAATEAFERAGGGEVATIMPKFDPDVKSSGIACVLVAVRMLLLFVAPECAACTPSTCLRWCVRAWLQAVRRRHVVHVVRLQQEPRVWHAWLPHRPCMLGVHAHAGLQR